MHPRETVLLGARLSTNRSISSKIWIATWRSTTASAPTRATARKTARPRFWDGIGAMPKTEVNPEAA